MSEQQVQDVNVEEVAIIQRGSKFLAAKEINFHGLPVSHVAFVFGHPTVEKLVLQDCNWDSAVTMGTNEKSLVNSIELLNCSINDFGFGMIFENFPKLRQLTYSRAVDEIDTDFDLIGNILRQHGTKLEYLRMINDSSLRFTTPIGSLCDLSNLKTLEIGLEFLIGFHENPLDYDDYADSPFFDPARVQSLDAVPDDGGDWSLVELLPKSLEKLTLYIETPKMNEYFNTYERYGAKLAALMAADSRFSNLVYIEAPGIDSVVKNTDRRRLIRWLSDFSDVAIKMPQTPWSEAKCYEKAAFYKSISAYFHPVAAANYHHTLFGDNPRYSPNEHINCVTNCYVNGHLESAHTSGEIEEYFASASSDVSMIDADAIEENGIDPDGPLDF